LYIFQILLEKLPGATHLRCRVQKATDLRLPKWTVPRPEALLCRGRVQDRRGVIQVLEILVLQGTDQLVSTV